MYDYVLFFICVYVCLRIILFLYICVLLFLVLCMYACICLRVCLHFVPFVLKAWQIRAGVSTGVRVEPRVHRLGVPQVGPDDGDGGPRPAYNPGRRKQTQGHQGSARLQVQ